MRRRGLLLAPAVALLALVSSAGAADQERSACQKLSAKHDLAPAKRVKLVRKKNDEGGNDLRGCVLPRGEVVKVASSSDEFTTVSSYELLQVAGHHVLVASSFSSQYGGNEDTYAVDLKRAKAYTLASSCSEGVDGFCNPDKPDATATRALLNSSGQSVAIVSRSSDLVTVEGFSARGARRVLDSGSASEIPASSLKLDGHVASWKNNGAEKSAKLPGVSTCQRLKAKHDLAPARKVKLVEQENADGGKDLVGCVLPAGQFRIIATSRPQGPSVDRYEVLQVAGHEVLLHGSSTTPYGTGESTYVYDIKRGQSYLLAQTCVDDQGAGCKARTRARRAFVNAQGQSVALLKTEGSKELAVVGFKSKGESEILDTGTAAEIPASSLSLKGHVVRWSHSGSPRQATLSG